MAGDSPDTAEAVNKDNDQNGSADEAVQVKEHHPLFFNFYIPSHVGPYLLYSKPIQRQTWADHQSHPVVNWGDLFFDLFYVAAAYNLSNHIVRQSPTWRGLLYFVACYVTVMVLWWDKMYYDARYYTKDDVLHFGFEICILVALGTAILHIRSVDTLSQTTQNIELFVFCLGIVAGTLLTILRYAEILLIGVKGGKEAIISSRRDIGLKTIPLILAIVAAVLAGRDFYNNNNNDSGTSYVSGNATDAAHRYLAGASATKSTEIESNDVPIYFMLASGLSYHVGILIMLFTLPGKGGHKNVTVPMNVDFCIHRYGEWIMLMLGENILSILIVEVSGGFDYYSTFFCAILSVVMLQYLHFRSQPQHAEDHAMRRSREAGVAFVFLMQIYSGALILLGTSFKMLLYEYSFIGRSKRRARMMLQFVPRWLAGGDGALRFPTDDRRQRIAYFFCFSMATVWLCSDFMILTHQGIHLGMGRVQCPHTGKIRVKGVLLILVRVVLIGFIATLCLYETDPAQLAVIGLASIVTQIALRVFSMMFFGFNEFPQDELLHIEVKEELDDDEPTSHDTK